MIAEVFNCWGQRSLALHGAPQICHKMFAIVLNNGLTRNRRACVFNLYQSFYKKEYSMYALFTFKGSYFDFHFKVTVKSHYRTFVLKYFCYFSVRIFVRDLVLTVAVNRTFTLNVKFLISNTT